jgi:hypothetical protein
MFGPRQPGCRFSFSGTFKLVANASTYVLHAQELTNAQFISPFFLY